MKDLVSSMDIDKQEKCHLLGFEVSYGCVHGWTVQLSTVPQQRGVKLMNGKANTFSRSEMRAALNDHLRLDAGAVQPNGGWHIDT